MIFSDYFQGTVNNHSLAQIMVNATPTTDIEAKQSAQQTYGQRLRGRALASPYPACTCANR